MDSLMSVLSAFGLATAAGLNAYLPLLIVALLARFTDLITLTPPWDTLESWWAIGVLAALLIIEFLVDKVPAVDSINDIIHTFIRPTAGAILFAASSGVITDTSPVLALICGLLIAGGVHAAKATVRTVVTATTGGVLNPLVSVIEDAISLLMTLLAIVMPVLALVLLVVAIVWFIRWRRRRAKGDHHPAGEIRRRETMQDEYQQVPYAQPEPKKKLTGGQIAVIVIAVIVALACLCPTAVVALMALIGPEVGDVFSTIIDTLGTVTPVP